MSYEVDLTDARKAAIDLAVRAGNIARENFETGNLSIVRNVGLDIVTVTDHVLNQFLVGHISALFPETEIMAEESQRQEDEFYKNKEYLWIIDPLDGSKNFSRGVPYFAVSIALARRNRTVLGVVYKPMTDEIYWAQEGVEGAWLNNRQVRVSPTNNLEGTTIAWEWVKGNDHRQIMYQRLPGVLFDVGQIVSRSSAVCDISSVADGRTDAYLNRGLNPWDVAAASYFVEKAGGMVTTPEGKPWDIFHPNILATNGILHPEILRKTRV